MATWNVWSINGTSTVESFAQFNLPTVDYTPNAVVELLQYFCQDHGVHSVTVDMPRVFFFT